MPSNKNVQQQKPTQQKSTVKKATTSKVVAPTPKINEPMSQNININTVQNDWQKLFSVADPEDVIAALGAAYTNNPYVQNQRTKKVSSQPFSTSRESLEKSIADPMNNELTLRQTSQSLRSNYSVLKLNTMYSDILTYRYYWMSKYVTPEQRRSDKFKSEQREISKWVDLLQPKRTFHEIVNNAQWEGKTVYYMRDSRVENSKTFDYVYLQHLPSDFVKIVGWNTASKFTISFDFTYFWQAGTSPQQFPPIFEKFYQELNGIFTEKNKTTINPLLLNPNGESGTEIYYKDNKWFYWKELPMDECFVFSQDEATPYQMPNTIGLFLQAQDLQTYQFLQQQLLQLPLTSVIMGTLPMNKDSGGTISTDNYAIGTEAYKYFTSIFDTAAPQGTKLFLTPATNYEFYSFENNAINNSTVVTNALQQFNAVAGVAGLNCTTDKPNIAQVKTQQIMEARYVASMYPQFEECINLWWKNKLGLAYVWNFKIRGTVFEDMADFSRVEKGISLGQNYLMSEYLSYFGLRIDDVIGLQDEIIDSKIYDKFQVVQSAFNSREEIKDITTTKSKGGRPPINENDIESDNTANAIESGSNVVDGRETMSLKYCVECGERLIGESKYYPFCCEECKIENEERVGGENA